MVHLQNTAATQLGPDPTNVLCAPKNAPGHQRSSCNESTPWPIRQAGGGIVQRNGESAKLLKELATPQIKPGPQIEVQKELVEKLDELDPQQSFILNLGGILFNETLNKDKKVYGQAKFVVLPQTGAFISNGVPMSEKLINKPKLVALLLTNTLATMIDAKQVEYLRLAGLPNDEWKILVEIQYYRERPVSQTGFHKDTKGETLFVNLNYHMDGRVLGPEFVVNPEKSEAHDKLIKTTLPQQFLNDLNFTRENLAKPTEYGTSIVNSYDYVAFVDEAIHHATPYYYNRYVTGANLEAFLTDQFLAEMNEAKNAYTDFRGQKRVFKKPFERYVNKKVIPKHEIPKWNTLAELVSDSKNKITRNDLNKAMTSEEFDRVLEWVGGLDGERDNRTQGAPSGFHNVVIEHDGPLAIKSSGPPLKRKLSDPDFRKTLPQAPSKNDNRSFFRTWVRVIPAEKAELLLKAQSS
jgi:hypothetical protein